MYNQNEERIYFNQNFINYRDKIYNSGGTFEISISNNTVDYKNFSSPNLLISIIGENKLRRMCSLNYTDTIDLYNSIKEIIQNIENIYNTQRNNVINKKYQFDRNLKFEFIYIKDINERVVSVSIIHNTSDFAKVVIPYSVFCSFAIGILKYFVNEYVNVTFSLSTRNLLTEILDQNKLIRNGIMILPSSISQIDNKINGGESTQVAAQAFENDSDPSCGTAERISDVLDDFEKFLGKDMENIVVEDLTSKAVLEEKKNNNEITSRFVTKTLTNDLEVFESMLAACVSRPDPMISLFEGFRRSMNLSDSFNFLPMISKENLKSLLYVSKFNHDFFVNSAINENKAIPSGFQILKYKVEDFEKIDFLNVQLAYDILLISGFMKIFRSRMESRVQDIDKNGSLFYLRIRTFLDPLVYSFLDEKKGKIITTNICNNFEKYETLQFFNHYQKILSENGFTTINVNDIREFCNEVNDKVLTKGILDININDRHENMFKNGTLRINIDNKLSIEQILNQLLPLEILEKSGVDLNEGSEKLTKAIEIYSIEKDVLDIFLRKDKEEKVKISNISKTVKFYNNEIPDGYREEFFKFIDDLKESNFDFQNSSFPVEELGENIIKSLYVWNESDNKKEPLSNYRAKLEECLLTKELILAKYLNSKIEEKEENVEWNLELLND